MNRSDEDAAAAAIREIEARLDDARVRGDAAAFEQVLADDFHTTSPAGGVLDRKQTLADARSGTLRVSASESRNITIRVRGTTAIVTGTAVMAAKFRGHDISGAYAYTHVYMLRDARWQVVAAHSSWRMPDWVLLVLIRVTQLFRLSRR